MFGIGKWIGGTRKVLTGSFGRCNKNTNGKQNRKKSGELPAPKIAYEHGEIGIKRRNHGWGALYTVYSGYFDTTPGIGPA